MRPYTNLTDTELIINLNHGSESAFEEIYRRYWKPCYQAAYKILKDDDTCMDILQDIFAWLWENKKDLRLVELGAYLCTAVRFKMLNFIRNNRKRCQSFTTPSEPDATALTAEEILAAKQLTEMLEAFTRRLPKQAGKIFYLSRYEQLSHKEIADHLNLSEKTVKKQIHLALKRLKATINGAYLLLL